MCPLSMLGVLGVVTSADLWLFHTSSGKRAQVFSLTILFHRIPTLITVPSLFHLSAASDLHRVNKRTNWLKFQHFTSTKFQHLKHTWNYQILNPWTCLSGCCTGDDHRHWEPLSFLQKKKRPDCHVFTVCPHWAHRLAVGRHFGWAGVRNKHLTQRQTPAGIYHFCLWRWQ